MLEIPNKKRIMSCPRCNSEVFKVHRKGINKIIGYFVKTRQFDCSNKACNFTAIRLTKSRNKFKNPFVPISPLRNKLNMVLLIIFVLFFWYFLMDLIVNGVLLMPRKK